MVNAKQSLLTAMSREVAAERVDLTDGGLVFPALSVQAAGEYVYRAGDGGEIARAKNLITLEGMAHILNVALGSTPKAQGYYLALFNGSAAPQQNWTAASFTATAGELTSQTEGYTHASRPLWTPQAATGAAIDNMGDGGDDLSHAAKVVIATASQLSITGVALLTAAAKGATTGVLVSAAKLPLPRTLQNGDPFYIGYRLSLTV